MKWDNGNEGVYRMGADGKYDLFPDDPRKLEELAEHRSLEGKKASPDNEVNTLLNHLGPNGVCFGAGFYFLRSLLLHYLACYEEIVKSCEPEET